MIGISDPDSDPGRDDDYRQEVREKAESSFSLSLCPSWSVYLSSDLCGTEGYGVRMRRATQGHLLLLELPRAGGSAVMGSSLETVPQAGWGP